MVNLSGLTLNLHLQQTSKNILIHFTMHYILTDFHLNRFLWLKTIPSEEAVLVAFVTQLCAGKILKLRVCYKG